MFVQEARVLPFFAERMEHVMQCSAAKEPTVRRLSKRLQVLDIMSTDIISLPLALQLMLSIEE